MRFGFRASRTYKGLGHCFGLSVLGFKGLGIMGFRVLGLQGLWFGLGVVGLGLSAQGIQRD